jgi:hypothetical protein
LVSEEEEQIGHQTVEEETFFSLNCLWWNRSPFRFYFPLPPLRGQPTAKCHPRWQPVEGLAVHGRLGEIARFEPRKKKVANVNISKNNYNWKAFRDGCLETMKDK